MYRVMEEDQISSPALMYYKDYIVSNTEKMIEIANGVQRMWPHVKTHKCAEMIRLLQSYNINRFKGATIAECEMVAQCGAEEVILAYPLVGPDIERFMQLQKRFPNTRFWAIQEDFDWIKKISDASIAHGLVTPFLFDVNPGMNRTGMPIDSCVEMYKRCVQLQGIRLDGFHCYDGNHIQPDFNERMAAVRETAETLRAIRRELTEEGYDIPIIVVAGTPAFPCYREYMDFFVSPGTGFLFDYGYQRLYDDIPLTPAGLILARVISCPTEDIFTIDVGAKAIAADPKDLRGIVVGYEGAVETVLQNEEHWVMRVKADSGKVRPSLGDVLYVIPTHICPTSALYPSAHVVEKGHVIDQWEITARNRKLTI